jgi:hypothetical protein
MLRYLLGLKSMHIAGQSLSLEYIGNGNKENGEREVV